MFCTTHKGFRNPFLNFTLQNPNSQANDLLLGLAPMCWPPRAWGRQVPDYSLEASSLAALRRFDIVAPLERMDELVSMLCDELALPHCPCYPVKRVADPAAYERARATATGGRARPGARIGDDGGLQQELLQPGSKQLDALLRRTAWADWQMYQWARVAFEQRRLCAGVARERSTLGNVDCSAVPWPKASRLDGPPHTMCRGDGHISHRSPTHGTELAWHE